MISLILYNIFKNDWEKEHRPLEIKNTVLFYILQWTWGLLANIAGVVVMLVFLVKTKPQKYGRCISMQLPVNWGLSLGMFIFGEVSCLPHEHGHSFQNALYGPFFLTTVALPSVIRFWYRRYKTSRGVKLEPYDSVWFEGMATITGKKYMEQA